MSEPAVGQLAQRQLHDLAAVNFAWQRQIKRVADLGNERVIGVRFLQARHVDADDRPAVVKDRATPWRGIEVSKQGNGIKARSRITG